MYKKYNIQIGHKTTNKYGDIMEVVDILPKHRLLVKFNENDNVIKNVKLYDYVDGKCKSPSTSKIGEQYHTKQGYIVTVIDYIDCRNVKIQFNDNRHTQLICRYDSIYNGVIKNPYHKTVMDIACLGQIPNEIPRNIYEMWYDMIQRCYIRRKDTEAYKDCIVSEEWLCYENFQKWYDYNYYEVKNKQDKMCLDKDILYKNNTIYSPNTCCFVPNSINVLFKHNTNHNISHRKDGYSIYCGRTTGKHYIGHTTNKEEAIKLSNQARTEYLHEIVSQYENQLPYYLYKYLIEYTYEDSYNE